jgi:two-component system, OmpR family, sensor histidine kinase BaeS
MDSPTRPPDDGRRRHDWGGGGWGPPRRRPQWWPEAEPWPPQGPEAWRLLRRRFVRRIAVFIGFFVAFLIVVTAGGVWLLTTLFGPGWVSAILALVVVLVLISVVGRIVRTARVAVAPMGELIEASARVEAGEFGTQVSERGPRDLRTLARAFNAMSSRLAETDAARRRLLADVGHELRTPLTVIQGNVEGMLDGLYPTDRPHLERILAETRQMERLIEDLRTLSLADAGALALAREPTDLAALATDVAAAFAPQAESAGIELALEHADGLAEIELDPLRVRQVVANLVTNALRHTPPGGRVTVRIAEADGAQALTVSDTGTGMEPDALAHAFDRFWRAGESPGAGLGLAIVRDLVAAHGGSVELESQPGHGTTVVCRFPARAPAPD